MIVVMAQAATEADVQGVVERVRELGESYTATEAELNEALTEWELLLES